MKMTYRSAANSGFTLLEIMIVAAVIGLLAALAIPSVVHARDTARLNTIYRNLRTLEEAKDQWAIENKMPTGASVDNVQVLNLYLRGGGIADVMQETYVPNPVGTPAEATLPNDVALGPYAPGAAIPAP